MMQHALHITLHTGLSPGSPILAGSGRVTYGDMFWL